MVIASLRRMLERANPVLFTTVAGLAGFSAYFSMYAFRKPFSAATFAVVPGWNFVLDYKIALVIAQVAGYALSKMLGIKIISELDPAKRASAIVVLILTAELALVLFALIPAPWNVAAMFLNGLPLGMIWAWCSASWKAGAPPRCWAPWCARASSSRRERSNRSASWSCSTGMSAPSGCRPSPGRCSCRSCLCR
jgi:hypothetical protein